MSDYKPLRRRIEVVVSGQRGSSRGMAEVVGAFKGAR